MKGSSQKLCTCMPNFLLYGYLLEVEDVQASGKNAVHQRVPHSIAVHTNKRVYWSLPNLVYT